MKKYRQRGFTLVEILMVLIIVAILAAVGMNAFIDFQTEARDASLRSNLGALRAGIVAQIGNMQLRCASTTKFPDAADITANDITTNVQCTAGEVADASDRLFITGSIPENPWGCPLCLAPTIASNTITDCTAGDCTPGSVLMCDGSIAGAETSTGGWCYNPATGEIWPDMNDAAKELF